MYYIATGNITIRSTPELTTSNRTGDYVLAGDVVEVDASRETNGFAYLINRYRNNIKIPLPVGAWCGTFYLQEEPDFTPPIGIEIPDYLIAHFSDGSEKRYLPE